MCKTVFMLYSIFLIQIGGGQDGIFALLCDYDYALYPTLKVVMETRARPVKTWPGQETISEDQRNLL